MGAHSRRWPSCLTPSSRTMAGAASPMKAYQPHHAHHAGGDEDREPQAREAQLLEGDPQTTGAGIVQLQHTKGADQQGGQGPGQQQPRQQVADTAPAVLGQ